MSFEFASPGNMLYRVRRRLRHLVRQVTERSAIRVGFMIVVIALSAAVGLHVVEHEPPDRWLADATNDGKEWPYSTYIGTVQQVGILLFSGFDAEENPQTRIGFSLTMLCLFLGIALLALLTADLATLLIAAAADRGRRRVRLTNHIVVCGWHHTARAIVDQLTSRDHRPRRKIVVVDEEAHDLRLINPDIEFVRGDPTDMESLRLASTDRASVAIIPIDWSFSEDIQDSRTTLATLAVKSMNEKIYTCAELLHPSNRPHIERTEVDEVICVGEFSQKLISLAAVSHGLSRLFDEILTFDKGSEVHRVALPEKLVGRTFRWLLAELNEQRSCVLMSVQRGADVFTNPQGEFVLEEGDQLFVLAERPPSHLERLAKS